jgi:hypothetical protein
LKRPTWKNRRLSGFVGEKIRGDLLLGDPIKGERARGSTTGPSMEEEAEKG